MNRMIGCSRCQGFSERFYLYTPREYRDLARQLIEIVNQGTFLLLHSTYALKDLLGEVFPDDIISHDFQCTGCGRAFQLSADTYHGNVCWKPLE